MMRWLVYLMLALLPIKYLSYKVMGADITAFRVVLLIALFVFCMKVIVNSRYHDTLRMVSRTRALKAIRLFLFWSLVGLAIGALRADNEVLARRAVFSFLSFLTSFYLFPMIVLTELLHMDDGSKVLSRVSKLWLLLILGAFLQEALYLFGLPINSESIFAPEGHPVSVVLGMQFLRPYSVLGEPRDLASVVVPFTYLYAFFKERNTLTRWQIAMILILGVLLSSGTFYVFVILFLVYYFIFDRGRHEHQTMWKVMSIVIVGLLIWMLSSQLENYAPRLASLVRELQSEDFYAVGGGVFNQAPDLLLMRYVRDLLTLRIGVGQILFGGGLGSFTTVIDTYYVGYFGFPLSYLLDKGGVVTPRVLPFTLLVETGVLGLVLFVWTFWEVYRGVSKINVMTHDRRAALRLILVATLIGSCVQASYLFVVGYVVCLYFLVEQGETDLPTKMLSEQARISATHRPYPASRGLF